MHLQEGKYIQLLKVLVWRDRFGMMPCIEEGWLYHIPYNLREAVVAAVIAFTIFMPSVLG